MIKSRHNLLATKLDDEVVIYDPETKQAHSMNAVAVSVLNHAERAKTVQELRGRVSADLGIAVDEAAVVSALRKLERAGLLLDTMRRTGPLTRRELLGKGAKLGAVGIVTPVIASAFVPMAAAAASACPVAGNCINGQNFPICAVPPGSTGCLCTTSTEGTNVCVGNWLCGTVLECTSTSQCPSGSECVVNSFCTCGTPLGNCAPPCGGGISPQPGSGQTALFR